MTVPTAACSPSWTLTEFGQGEQQQRTITLPNRPLIVGRSAQCDIAIASHSVSKRHARIHFDDGQMIVEDLDSTNGTHLNGAAIDCCVAVDGDLLQFANALFRVNRVAVADQEGTLEEGILPWAQTLLVFDRLISERKVIPFFQPIVTIDRQTTPAYELLARSNMEGLNNPALMFGAAERLGQQAALSELMREEGMCAAQASAISTSRIFLNTHPSEIVNDRLLDSLRDLRESHPGQPMTIEVHEAAVTDPASMKRLRAALAELEMQLSYDDFGAGQGRLLELGEVPPQVLKFDMQLIRDIDSASAKRQELLATLVKLAVDLGAIPLAEGVETEAEHTACRQLGFALGQGFLYGRPQPLEAEPVANN